MEDRSNTSIYELYFFIPIILLALTGCGAKVPPADLLEPIDATTYKTHRYILKIGHLNKDPFPDLILLAPDSHTLNFFLGNANGVPTTTIEKKIPDKVITLFLRDINSDRIDDILVITSTHLYTFLQISESASPVKTTFHGNDCHQFDLADIDQDQIVDLFCLAMKPSSDQDLLIVFKGNGDGTFSRISDHTWNTLPNAITTLPTTDPLLDYGEYNTKEYTIGPGDVLEISLWKSTGLESTEVKVRSDGRISMRFIEDLRVTGMTISELDNTITRQLKEYYVDPKVDVVVKEYIYQQVALFGAIERLPGSEKSGPGIYTLTRPTRIVELLTLAGGLKASADKEDVVITRKNGQMIRLNLNTAYADVRSKFNMYLIPGDTVYIPDKEDSQRKVFVMGEVLHPGRYPIKRASRLLDIIPSIGGFKEYASPGNAKIIRKHKSREPEHIPVNIEKLLAGDARHNIFLKDGDILFVP